MADSENADRCYCLSERKAIEGREDVQHDPRWCDDGAFCASLEKIEELRKRQNGGAS